MYILRNVSLKGKLMLIIMLTSSTALLLACAAFVLYDVAEFRKKVVEDLTMRAEVIGSAGIAALKFKDPKTALEILYKLKTERRILPVGVHAA